MQVDTRGVGPLMRLQHQRQPLNLLLQKLLISSRMTLFLSSLLLLIQLSRHKMLN